MTPVRRGLASGMFPRSLQFVADAAQGVLLSGGPGIAVRRVVTDSRQVGAGDLFVPLAGEKFDGHSFLGDVAARGAAAVLVADRRRAETAGLPASLGVVSVADTRVALGRLAARHRESFTHAVVAVGGSNGKTTTKELIASVLRQRFRTVWSEASFNNDIGVPLTLLRLDSDTQAAVLEVGSNHPGELPPLLDMIRPRLGVITSIGREHLEFFRDLAGVAREEGFVGEALPADGTLFLPGDSEWAPALAARTCAAVVRVGFGARLDWVAEGVTATADGMRFGVRTTRGGFSGDYSIRLIGRHQVGNALYAIAVGAELGLTPDEVRRGLAECAPAKMRLQLHEVGGVRILDDAYNANADSMLAALQALRDLPCSGRRVAVLGDMAELGERTCEAHEEVGRRAAELGVDRLVTVGAAARTTAAAARAAGLADVVEFTDVPAAAAAMPGLIGPGDLVLLKASRSAALERVTEGLRRAAGAG